MNRRTAAIAVFFAVLPACVPPIQIGPVAGGSASPAPVTTPSPAPSGIATPGPAVTPSASASPRSPEAELARECGLYDAALATVNGRVTDDAGNPLAGVSVAGSIPGDKGGDPCMPETIGKDAVWQSTTDKDGFYTLKRTRPSSPMLLTASREGRIFSRMVIQPAVNLQGDLNVNRYDLTWRATATDDPGRASLVGRVYDPATYTDLNGLAVTATLTAGRFANGSDSQLAISGPFGRYRFDGVPLDSPVRLEVAHVHGKRVSVGPLKPLETSQSATLLVIPF